MTPARALQWLDSYLPIEDHALIGDDRGAALVGRDGGISWMCVPRFDSPPLVCGLLDRQRGGEFVVAPEQLRESRQYYSARHRRAGHRDACATAPTRSGCWPSRSAPPTGRSSVTSRRRSAMWA